MRTRQQVCTRGNLEYRNWFVAVVEGILSSESFSCSWIVFWLHSYSWCIRTLDSNFIEMLLSLVRMEPQSGAELAAWHDGNSAGSPMLLDA